MARRSHDSRPGGAQAKVPARGLRAGEQQEALRLVPPVPVMAIKGKEIRFEVIVAPTLRPAAWDRMEARRRKNGFPLRDDGQRGRRRVQKQRPEVPHSPGGNHARQTRPEPRGPSLEAGSQRLPAETASG